MRAREVLLYLVAPVDAKEGGGGLDVLRLHAAGYGRWLVLEQDTAITGEEPPVGRGPVIDVRTSIDYLHPPAPARRERVAES